jgi:hypothetical protein
VRLRGCAADAIWATEVGLAQASGANRRAVLACARVRAGSRLVQTSGRRWVPLHRAGIIRVLRPVDATRCGTARSAVPLLPRSPTYQYYRRCSRPGPGAPRLSLACVGAPPAAGRPGRTCPPSLSQPPQPPAALRRHGPARPWVPLGPGQHASAGPARTGLPARTSGRRDSRPSGAERPARYGRRGPTGAAVGPAGPGADRTVMVRKPGPVGKDRARRGGTGRRRPAGADRPAPTGRRRTARKPNGRRGPAC